LILVSLEKGAAIEKEDSPSSERLRSVKQKGCLQMSYVKT
jgi:hypothetical protein